MLHYTSMMLYQLVIMVVKGAIVLAIATCDLVRLMEHASGVSYPGLGETIFDNI